MKKNKSVSLKIMAAVVTAILVTALTSGIQTTISVSRDYQNIVEHYMGDVVLGYGQLIREYAEGGSAFTSEEVTKELRDPHL